MIRRIVSCDMTSVFLVVTNKPFHAIILLRVKHIKKILLQYDALSLSKVI